VFSTVSSKQEAEELSRGIPTSNIVLINDFSLATAEWIRTETISQFDIIFNDSRKKVYAHGLEHLLPFGSYVHIQSDEVPKIPSGAAS